ncbi:MAG: L-aspartate oxidase [Actinomycetota bacterium]
MPARLAAPEPTWAVDIDVVVLGSGAAGLSAALAARPVRDVLLVTKDTLDAGSTNWAQGGLAAVLDPGDSLESHVRDTLAAGAGLCDEAAVRTLVAEAPTAIRYLTRLGAAFDESSHDHLALTREGGHSHRRIVHAGGDQSGAEVQRTLDESVRLAGVRVVERAFALDLLIGTLSDGRRAVAGVRVALLDETGAVESVGDVTARAVVIATGGFGQVFASTSNPPAVTGDGVAMALRAGVPVVDIEFSQFHPTVLWTGPDATGQQALISEAVRGEGAVLVDASGARVMEGVHPQADLAPRDVVASAISARMAESPNGVDEHVFLDARSIGSKFETRFPSITASCLAEGIDPGVDLIPVAPAAHYVCGGVKANLDGATELVGLYVVGEAACTGVHGANRLASNSLTESVVAGTRVGRALSWSLPSKVEPEDDERHAALLSADLRGELRSTMSKYVGVLRSAEGLATATDRLARLEEKTDLSIEPSRRSFEATNMLTLARAVVAAASARVESRGCHRRADAPQSSDSWKRHLYVVDSDATVVESL